MSIFTHHIDFYTLNKKLKKNTGLNPPHMTDPPPLVGVGVGEFGGGGHQAAAGARIAGRPMGVQRRVVAAIRRALDGRPS